MADNSKLVRILSIDGGGIRGIIPAKILVTLEEKLRELDNNPSGKLADYFDLFAGTSTGGILTCIYLCPENESLPVPRFSAEDALDLYTQNGEEIFDVSLWQRIRSGRGLLDEKYSAKALEDNLKGYLKDLKLSQMIKPCLVTAYDIRRRRAHFFTQHDAVKRPSHDFFIKDVARATSAAPTYFEVPQVKSMSKISYPLIDGGVFVNNPALCAYSEARGLDFGSERAKHPTAKQMLILSLGTGTVQKPYSYKKAKDWGLASWIKPLIDIMMSGVSETVDYQLQKIFDSVSLSNQYLRINPGLGLASPDMDNATGSNLAALEEAGAECAVSNEEALIDFAKLLIANK